MERFWMGFVKQAEEEKSFAKKVAPAVSAALGGVVGTNVGTHAALGGAGLSMYGRGNRVLNALKGGAAGAAVGAVGTFVRPLETFSLTARMLGARNKHERRLFTIGAILGAAGLGTSAYKGTKHLLKDK